MGSLKITKDSVDAVPLPEAGKRAYLWDGAVKGFGLMKTDRGACSYILQYRVGGRGSPTRRVTIGKHGSPWTPDSARKRALELLEHVRRKIDPFEVEREAVAANRAKARELKAGSEIADRLGFSTFADRFVERYAKVEQPKSWKETEGIIRRDLKPALGNRPLTEITDADLVELIDEISERGASAALKAYKTLRLIFGYACDKERRHLPPANSPMLGMKPPSKPGKRDRTLSDAELRLVWMAAGGLGWPFGAIIRLLILNGQRRDEVGGLAWGEIDRDKRQWLLPGPRSKNRLPNLVHLSDPALAIIDDLPRIKSDAGLMFTTTGETAVSGFSKVKARIDASVIDLLRKEAIEAGATEADAAKLKVEPWTLHDLRRTVATGCQRLGFPTEVTEALINHVSGSRAGIVGTYQTYRYESETRAALNAWARHVTAVVSGSLPTTNVIDLAGRAVGASQ